ncbi:MAG: beta-ketoacyl-[acyl-carrier-protein] synthase family protein [Gemmatimonadetes bacterium]|nr:beta-ketoacyl-[acyl-carrier-protein] synthase family protein [Gemmatimonadota bacterium]
MKQQHRVFLLDYDLISPLGVGRREVFSSLAANRMPAAKIRSFFPDALPIDYAAEVEFPLLHWYGHESEAIRAAARHDRKFELSLAVYHLMEERLRKITELASSERAGIIMGLGVDVPPIDLLQEKIHGTLDGTDDSFADVIQLINRDKSRISTVLNPYDLSSVFIAEKLGLGGFQKTVLTACTASTQAIAQGYESLARGEMDVIVAGGSDSIINLLALVSFSRLGVLASSQDPSRACKPFDLNRSGTLAGEAAGLCVLVSEPFLRAHRLEPMFEILGYGNTLDAYNITAPDPQGTGMKRAFSAALMRAGVTGEQVDYINLHGTGTRSNDPVEIDAVISVFGEAARSIPMSSTKDRHGHAIAAAGIQELGVLCLCMENDFVPCNVNLEKPIRESSEIDLVRCENRKAVVRTAVTTNFAFGGVNTALVLRRN